MIPRRSVIRTEVNKIEVEDFGKRLEKIENEFTQIWNNEFSPDWMIRDANIKRNKAVGELLKESVKAVRNTQKED